jgi:hypothetical protein
MFPPTDTLTGFEGPDLEVKKRKDIIKRSKVYVKDNIRQISDSKYLVPSQSNPSKLYEVDLDAYTCQCLDYPVISYCKHLCAVQELFDEPGSPPNGIRPHIQSLSPLPLPLPPSIPNNQAPAPLTSRQNPPLTQLVVEKLERLTARLRRPRKKDDNLRSLPDLEATVDAMLLETDSGSVLPSVEHLQSNLSSQWGKTQRGMMPAIKIRRKPAGDPSYGAGASSGSKMKESKPKK